ncbi:hypothetical protein GPECTOR_6g716 [Gonium pectorale]|uniref:Uncharacterized protein n=1 Tax=Gonium pectorale TaxID=33097 RepID=A0A150GVS9_GONPE|nr:hypothetical protein GPECTOR_6g716 [Gonium pectorale]|eukprot:KXZ53798.1 hypothetical protein GPECTOR_6g716 [Gonium pectorale]
MAAKFINGASGHSDTLSRTLQLEAIADTLKDLADASQAGSESDGHDAEAAMGVLLDKLAEMRIEQAPEVQRSGEMALESAHRQGEEAALLGMIHKTELMALLLKARAPGG